MLHAKYVWTKKLAYRNSLSDQRWNPLSLGNKLFFCIPNWVKKISEAGLLHNFIFYFCKGQIISKGLLVSSNSPKKPTNEFVFTTETISLVGFLGGFEDIKKSFRPLWPLRINHFFNKFQLSQYVSSGLLIQIMSQITAYIILNWLKHWFLFQL